MDLAHDLRQDAAFATRIARRQWLPTVLAVACLALGTGATTALFGVTNALLLRPFPLPNAARMMFVGSLRTGARDVGGGSYPDYLDWRTRQHSFDELAAYGPTGLVILASRALNASGALVSSNYFRMIGVAPVAGRLFVDGEDRIGGPPVAIVARGFADRELGGADHVLGHTLIVDGTSRTIVGIVADLGPMSADLWLPLARNPVSERARRDVNVLGTLRPGASIDAARRDMAALASQLAREHPETNADISAVVTPLREQYVGDAKPALFAMSIAAVLVLLVTCANVGGIQLARAVARAREIAVRSAVGATRGRLLRQLLTESLLIAFAGAGVGMAIAYRAANLAALGVIGPTPGWLAPSVDLRVLVFAVAAAALTGVLFGIVPAMRLARVDPADALGGARGAVGPARGRAQRVFVIAQIATSIVLLTAAGLAIESVQRVGRLPLGFDPANVATFRISMQGSQYDDAAKRGRLVANLTDRLATLPGIDAAGAISLIPIRSCCNRWGITIEGQDHPNAPRRRVTGNTATSGYFPAMSIRLLRGRSFTSGDGPAAPRVLLVNETFAKTFWPTGDALGHRVDAAWGFATIVGIVNDVKQGSVLDAPEPQFYWAIGQTPTTGMSIVLKTTRPDPAPLVPEIRAALRELDPTLPMGDLLTMPSLIDRATAASRTFQWMLVVFGIIGISLAAAGTFAVMSFHVSQRTRELGLRMALGAEPSTVATMVLRQGVDLAAVGAAIGLGASVVAARLLAHTLYGVSAGQLLVYLVAAGVVGAFAMIAAYVPARRAGTVDPMTALRAE